MPKFRFICSICKEETSRYVTVNAETLPCDICKAGTLERQLPTLSGQEVRETIDPVTNTRWKQDQQEILKKRKDDHFWEVEVPRLVQKYSLQTCLEEGWLVYNDKGQLVINKPPSKR